MLPYMTPDSFNHAAADPNTPTVSVLRSGGIVPGVPDIPYISADFMLEDIFFPGENAPSYIKAAIAPAKMTYWALSDAEAAALASGGMLQILCFTKEQPPIYPMVTYVNREPTDAPILHAMAKATVGALYGPAEFNNMSPESQAEWVEAMRGAAEVVLHFKDRRDATAERERKRKEAEDESD